MSEELLNNGGAKGKKKPQEAEEDCSYNSMGEDMQLDDSI